MHTKTAYVALVLAVLAVGCSAYVTKQAHNKIVSCYYSSWTFYRPGYGKFDIDDIPLDLCTHGFYGFADLNNQTWEIFIYDPWFDLAPDDYEWGCIPDPQTCNYDGYRRFVALKEQDPTFQPLLSVGGWNAGSGKYSMMAADPVKRSIFIESTIELIKAFGFAGLDLDWEYPGNREGTNPGEDKEHFSSLVGEFKTRLEPEGLLLTSALGCGYDKILVAYDVPYLSTQFDFMNIMGYDFNGAWNNYTGHNAPLIYRDEEHYETHPSYRYNLFDTLELYLELGAPPEKIIFGMPTYGRGNQLVNNERNGLFCPTDDGFPMGPYTQQKGTYAYLEVLQLFKNESYVYLPEAVPGNWTVVVDDCYKAPYMYNGPYWLSYDDPESIMYKTRFANFLGTGGAMIWTLDTDDFDGIYSTVRYPILSKINEELAMGEKFDPLADRPCGSAPMCDEYKPPTTTMTTVITSEATTMEETTTSSNPDTTTSSKPDTSECENTGDNLPYPGNCHMYLQCYIDGNGDWAFREFCCSGDHFFSVVERECVSREHNEDAYENTCKDSPTDCFN